MPYLRDRVIVLKKEPFREQDRRYVMYGQEHGLLVAVARGSSVRTSKQAGHLEPFHESEVMIAKGKGFDKLAVAKMVRPFGPSPRLAAYAVMGAFSDTVIRLIHPGIADERIFLLLQETIDVVRSFPSDPTRARADILFSAATLRLLDIIGYAPIIHSSAPATTPVPSLALLSYLRTAPLADALRITATTDILAAASGFVREALRATHLTSEPHGAKTIYSLC